MVSICQNEIRFAHTCTACLSLANTHEYLDTQMPFFKALIKSHLYFCWYYGTIFTPMVNRPTTYNTGPNYPDHKPHPTVVCARNDLHYSNPTPPTPNSWVISRRDLARFENSIGSIKHTLIPAGITRIWEVWAEFSSMGILTSMSFESHQLLFFPRGAYCSGAPLS